MCSGAGAIVIDSVLMDNTEDADFAQLLDNVDNNALASNKLSLTIIPGIIGIPVDTAICDNDICRDELIEWVGSDTIAAAIMTSHVFTSFWAANGIRKTSFTMVIKLPVIPSLTNDFVIAFVKVSTARLPPINIPTLPVEKISEDSIMISSIVTTSLSSVFVVREAIPDITLDSSTDPKEILGWIEVATCFLAKIKTE